MGGNVSSSAVSSSSNNYDKKDASRKKKRLFTVLISVFVALIMIVVFVEDEPPTEHTFGNITFSAPGEWSIKEEKSDSSSGVNVHTTVYSNGSYTISILDMSIPTGVTSDEKLEILDEFIAKIPNPQDTMTGDKGSVYYSGAWYVTKTFKQKYIQAGYVIVNMDNNDYVVVSISGKDTYKENIFNTYKSIKYKDISLYEE